MECVWDGGQCNVFGGGGTMDSVLKREDTAMCIGMGGHYKIAKLLLQTLHPL